MALEGKIDFTQMVRRAIEDGVKAEIEREWKVQEKLVIEALERRKTEAIAGLTLRIMKQIDMQNFGDKVVITLIQEK